MSLNAPCFIGKVNAKKTIHIIGGGFSGLCLGFFLKKNNIPFIIHEKESKPGGKIDSLQTSAGNGETGAHAFYVSDSMIKDLRTLNLEILRAQPKLKKKVYRDRRFASPPIKFREALILAWNFFTKRPPRFHEEMSLAEFLAPLGTSAVNRELFGAAMVGVYGADSQQLHLASLFKQVDFNTVTTYLSFLKQIKASKNKERYTSISFPAGMGSLIKAFQDELRDHIQLGDDIKQLPENCIICTDAHAAAELISASSLEKANALNKISYLPVTPVTIITSENLEQLKDSFGCLFSPQVYHGKIRGILNNWAIFPKQRKEKGLNSYTFIMATSHKPEQTLEDELQSLGLSHIFQNRKELLKHSWEKALPLYDSNRYRSIMKLKNEPWQELGIFGNYIGGISLREIFLSAKDLAQGLKND